MCTVCSNCGGADIEYDQSRGDAVCVQCGSVLEDNIIVSEVSFQEQSSGATSVIGQFVSSEGQNSASLSRSAFHHGMGKGSREITLINAKRRISKLGNMMKLNQHCIDSAFTFFKMALNLNLTKGRKASLVDTACLYMVCRTEGTPHLLLDFSDVLQINVYALGRAFLRLSDALHINPPAIDPCLYIHRFAHKLELGDKEHEVSKTALRLVARMKRDWLHHGRRPSGLCGAALLVAARLHNFNRTIKEVSKIVKVNQATIRNRLCDFKDTPSSRLTIEDFLQINLEQEHDPPSYSEARKRPKLTPSNEPEVGEFSTRPEHSLLNGSLLEDGNDAFLGAGISLQSVENTIAKAQATEQFRSNIIPSLGLGGDFSSLVKYAEEIPEEDTTQLTNGEDSTELDLTEIDDNEINAMLLGPDEVQMKSKIWLEENESFLKEQEEKRQRQEATLAAQGVKKKRIYKKRKQVQLVSANSAGEAIQQMLVEKKISSKINYDVLRELSDENSSQEPKADSDTTPSIEATPPPMSSAVFSKRTFSLLDSGSGVGSGSRNVPTYHGASGTPSRLPSLRGPQGSRISFGNPFSTPVAMTTNQSELRPSTSSSIEVVEEKGPINYDNELEGDEDDEHASDYDDDDMTYPGDPLHLSDPLHFSDYEEGNFEDGDDY